MGRLVEDGATMPDCVGKSTSDSGSEAASDWLSSPRPSSSSNIVFGAMVGKEILLGSGSSDCEHSNSGSGKVACPPLA